MIVVEVPIRIISEANNRDHWTKKNKRKLIIQNTILFYLYNVEKPNPPYSITIIRIAPRKLDFDNLCYSQKSVRDLICSWLIPGLKMGRADGHKDIKEIKYLQEKRKPKEYGLRIEIK